MSEWLTVGTLAELTKAKKKVVTLVDERQILVLVHEGNLYAFDNICVHRDRELHKGVILNGKLVCPGHQWAFALDTGWESIKELCQPTYTVELVGDEVRVDTASRTAQTGCSPQ
jgi:nitrite reductase (NADH) small subunit